MTAESIDVLYGEATGLPDAQHSIMSPFSFGETIERLKRAIAGEDLWVIHEIDPQMMLKKAGYAIGPARQILFFHPRFMAQLLAGNPAAVMEAPLRFVVLEMPDGMVTVRYPEPRIHFGRYARLTALATELSELYGRLARSIAGAAAA